MEVRNGWELRAGPVPGTSEAAGRLSQPSPALINLVEQALQEVLTKVSMSPLVPVLGPLTPLPQTLASPIFP